MLNILNKIIKKVKKFKNSKIYFNKNRKMNKIFLMILIWILFQNFNNLIKKLKIKYVYEFVYFYYNI
jgi:hypothetical protein